MANLRVGQLRFKEQPLHAMSHDAVWLVDCLNVRIGMIQPQSCFPLRRKINEWRPLAKLSNIEMGGKDLVQFHFGGEVNRGS